MPDYNAAVAAGIQPPAPVQQQNFGQTLSTVADFQRAQAATQLSQLQALQAQRKYNGLLAASQALAHGGDPLAHGAAAGADPADINQLLAAGSSQKFMSAHGGLAPAGAEANANIALRGAETTNARAQLPGIQAKSAQSDMEFRGGVAKSLAADPSDANWKATVPQLVGHVSPDGMSQILDAYKNPDKRAQVAKNMIAATLPSADAVKLEPGTNTTPLGRLSAPVQATAPGPQGQTPVPGQTPPLPGGQSPSGLGPTTPMGPRAVKGQEDIGAQDAAYTKATNESAQAARSVNYTLGNMMRDAANLPVGRGMATVAEGKAWLQSAYDNNIMGAKTWMPDPGKDATAAYDSMLKNSGQLTRQALMQTHERAAIAYDMIQKQLPSVSTSRGGLQNVAAELAGHQ